MSITLNGNPGESEVILNGNPGESEVVIDGLSVAEADFVLTESVIQTTITPGDPAGTLVVNDAVYDQQTTALVETGSQLGVQGSESAEFVSLDTDIAIVDGSGGVGWVANGTARILAKGANLWKRRNVTVSRDGGQSVNHLAHYATGSLAKYLCDSIDNAIVGKTSATNGNLFTSMDHVTPAYVRNTNCWVNQAGIDASCIGVWNNDRVVGIQGQWNHGFVLHPRIAIMAFHYLPPFHVGKSVRFVTMDNVVVDRVVDAALNVPATDMYLLRFEEALPGSINVGQVMPASWQDYLPTLAAAAPHTNIPIFGTDQFKGAYVENLSGITSVNGTISLPLPTETDRYEFHRPPSIGGDSGAPQCFVAGAQLIFVTSLSSTLLLYSNMLALLDAGMDTLVSGAASTKFDISGFTAY